VAIRNSRSDTTGPQEDALPLWAEWLGEKRGRAARGRRGRLPLRGSDDYPPSEGYAQT